MAQAIKGNIPDGANMAYLDREQEITRFTEFKFALKQTFVATPPPPPLTHFMDKISVRITTLKSTLGNVGTAQIVGPGTPEGSTGLHTRLGLGGVSQTDPTPAVIQLS